MLLNKETKPGYYVLFIGWRGKKRYIFFYFKLMFNKSRTNLKRIPKLIHNRHY